MCENNKCNIIFDENNGFNVCIECGKIQNYIYNNYFWEFDMPDQLKRVCYKRLTYLNILLNNINMKYIIITDELNNMYDNIKNNIKFDYQQNKKFIKKNKITNKYNNIYYFMFLKFHDKYNIINYDLRIKIMKLFLIHENIYNNNKSNFKLKKKFFNYFFILYKIFEILELDSYFKNMLDLPNKKILKKLNIYYNTYFFIN